MSTPGHTGAAAIGGSCVWGASLGHSVYSVIVAAVVAGVKVRICIHGHAAPLPVIATSAAKLAAVKESLYPLGDSAAEVIAAAEDGISPFVSSVTAVPPDAVAIAYVQDS